MHCVRDVRLRLRHEPVYFRPRGTRTRRGEETRVVNNRLSHVYITSNCRMRLRAFKLLFRRAMSTRNFRSRGSKREGSTRLCARYLSQQYSPFERRSRSPRLCISTKFLSGFAHVDAQMCSDNIDSGVLLARVSIFPRETSKCQERRRADVRRRRFFFFIYRVDHSSARVGPRGVKTFIARIVTLTCMRSDH